MPKNTTTIGFGSPSRYFQEHGQLNKLESYSRRFGTEVLALIDSFLFPEMAARLENLYAPEVIVGIGGRKTLDTAKAVGHILKIPIFVAPTTASTDGINALQY